MPLNDVLRPRTQALASTLNSHRILCYTLVSLLAVSVTIANALRNYSNFYSVAVSLSKSNRSVLALANFGFLVSLLCGHIVQRIFFGTLRANEVERLYDRLWFFITESLLAFTIFRDEFDMPFALMFGFLLFVKSFHWLAGDRIEWMDQRPYPGPSPLFHLRMTTLFAILWVTDFIMFVIAVENTIANGVGGMVLFASEYGILTASVLNTISKYLLSAYELRRAGRRGGENAPPWENKSMWVFYIELATDFLKLTTYLVFFTIIITFYGLPLNIVRDVYITARSFITRLRALHRYQTATRNMDQRYPNATADELTMMSDHTCIICREEMVLHEAGQAPVSPDGPNTTPKKLPCGHIFHFHCLRSWLERQQSCPTCRRTVLDAHPQGPDVTSPAAAAAPGEPERPDNPLPAAVRNQNNPRVNNPLGNPLGLMGRLFGPPAQPPILPGQLQGAQFPQNQHNTPQVPGNLAGQLPQGVVIQYHIQYQLPRNQHQNYQQPPPQPLQPPPQFAGFPGPRGAWQPWPQNGIAAQQPGPPNPTPLLPTPTPTVEPQPQQTPPTSAASTPTTSNGGDNSPTTPREAAALAALRRSASNTNGPSGVTTSQSVGSQTSAQGQLQATQATSSSSSPGPSSHGTLNNQSSGNVSGAPPLIPLYDYSAFGSTSITTPFVNGATTSPSSASNGEPHTRVSPGHAGNSRLPPRAVPHPSQSTQHPSGQGNLTASLPPTLTDDQLALMDRLTRDAIDERLRVLEGVSGAVYRCIDDLMRMRSALPSPAPALPIQSTPSVSSASSEPSGGASNLSGTVPARSPEISEASPTSGRSKNGDIDVLTNDPGGETEIPESSINSTADSPSDGDT